MKALRTSPFDNELRQLASSIQRKLSNQMGHLSESYLPPDKFDAPGKGLASGGFAVWKEVIGGKNVARKSVRTYVSKDWPRIRMVRKRATLFYRVAHTSYSGASVKKLSCGRACPIRRSSIYLGFLTPSRKGGPLRSPNGVRIVRSRFFARSLDLCTCLYAYHT